MSEFENADWIVTDKAMSSKKTDYIIALDDILEKTHRTGKELFEWPIQLAQKTWVDASLFNEAFEAACRLQARRSGEFLDTTMLSGSTYAALEIERRR